MYKILIVDDEAVVREGIRDNIDWYDLGFECIGDCANGCEAMEFIDKGQPDVVLTDICMPFVDGLELTRNISDKFPHIKVIILTGYDEFEYAQQAIRLKAYDFLLKPITASELRKIISKIKNDLDEEAKKADDLTRLKMQLRESLPLVRERFLNRLVSGYLRAGELNSKIEFLGLNFKYKYFRAMSVDIDDYGEFTKFHPGTDDELLMFAVYNVCDELVARENSSGIVFQSRNDRTIIIIPGDDEHELREISMRLSESIRQSIEKYLKFTVTIGLGVLCSRPCDLVHSYKGAVSALDYRFILGKNRVIDIADMEQSSTRYHFHKMQWEKRLNSAIKIGTTSEIDEVVEFIIKDLKNSFTPVERCYIHIQQIITSIINTIDELGMDENEVFINHSPFTEVYNFKTLDEIEAWLKNLSKKAAGYILDRRKDYSKVQVMKAEEFIQQNYSDEKISLNTVCGHLFISTSYFSLIFKNHTGQTFVEYLTRIRVEKAKELLQNTALKTYEISGKVGYSDPHYFSLIFKKATGRTPTEYREKMARGNLENANE